MKNNNNPKYMYEIYVNEIIGILLSFFKLYIF